MNGKRLTHSLLRCWTLEGRSDEILDLTLNRQRARKVHAAQRRDLKDVAKAKRAEVA